MITINTFPNRRSWGGRLVRAAAALAAFVALPAWSASNAITDIDYSGLPGNKVRVTLTLKHPVADPQSFTIKDPARIALDLADTTTELPSRSVDIGVGAVQDVTAIQAAGRSRIVIRLAQLVPYEVESDDNRLHILLDSAGTANSGAVVSSFGSPSGTTSGHSITNVDFRRSEDGAGRVLISLSNSSTPVNIRQEGGKLIADFYGTQLPEKLERRLDVTDFATPVRFVDMRRVGDNVRLEILPTEDEYDQIAYQAGDIFTLEFKPLTKEEQAARQLQPQFDGERLSLNFQDIEVRSVLQLIADFTGLNVVVSDSVGGNITLRLQDVPWDQALHIILQTKGLDKREQGNVLLVAPAAEIAAYERQQLESQQALIGLRPLRSEFVQINYAKASDLARLISSGDTKLLSERGAVTVDERTNTLIVKDTDENLGSIRQLVTQLDIPVRQVLIESRVVIANDDFARNLGVQWTASDSGFPTSPNPGGTSADYDGGAQGGLFGDRLVALPAAGATSGIELAVRKVGSYLLGLELTAMENEGRGDIVSSPRVITANQKPANIEQGVEIPYSTVSENGTETQFKKAVLGLTVTPQITPDNRVMLDLEVSKDSIGQQTLDGPAINTQSVTTQVLVDNGETVVLGGVYERTNQNDVNRVPLFGELPVVGHLFRSTSKLDRRSELLIFVTPKILDESLSVR